MEANATRVTRLSNSRSLASVACDGVRWVDVFCGSICVSWKRNLVEIGRRVRSRRLGPGQGIYCSIQPVVVLTAWSVEGAWVSSSPPRRERADFRGD